MARDYDHLFKLLIIGDSGKKRRKIKGRGCGVKVFFSPLCMVRVSPLIFNIRSNWWPTSIAGWHHCTEKLGEGGKLPAFGDFKLHNFEAARFIRAKDKHHHLRSQRAKV
jgi:hypothetical protein